MKPPRAWYRISAQAGSDVAELVIFDEIGKSFWNDDAVPATQVLEELRALPESIKTIRVRVNSPGGNPFDAAAIANALRAQRVEKGRAVEVSIEGLAASAATIVTSAGQPIRIADNAVMMIHNPTALAIGDAGDMREMADALDRVRDAIVATYRWVSSLAVEEIHALMDATTWMGAQEAVDKGFATEVVHGGQIAASVRPDAIARLGTIPEAYRAKVDQCLIQPVSPPPPPTPASAAEVLRACKTAGCLDLADELLAVQATPEQVAARIAAVVEARAAAESRAKEIRALCAVAKLPELADGYVRGGMSVADVRAHLTALAARFDRLEIDTALRPDPERQAAVRAALNPATIYAERNQLGRQKE